MARKRKLSDANLAVNTSNSPRVVPLKYVLICGCFIFLVNVIFVYKTLEFKQFTNWKSVENDFPTPADIPKCNITIGDAVHAIERAKTVKCKKEIEDLACRMEKGDYGPIEIERTCHLADHLNTGKYLGCYVDSVEDRLFNSTSFKFQGINTPDYCMNACLRVGFQVAGLQYRYECFCGQLEDLEIRGKRVSDDKCQMYECPGDTNKRCGGFKTMAVYNTGLGEATFQNAEYVEPTRSHIHYNSSSLDSRTEIYRNSSVRIAFLLQLNGRDVRQVRRLLKLIYSPYHYYLVHVDSREDFMFREMLDLERKLSGIGNFHVKRNRFSTIWGGASLLEMILDSIRDLTTGTLALWKWDFLYNLSESDFPIASLPEFEAILARYKGFNFLKGHGHTAAKFITKQGLDRIFLECEHRMWRIGKREYFPNGLRIDGGSDWFGLDRKFAHFATNSQQNTPKQIRELFKNVLLPAESYFHSVCQTTEFCDKIVNNNLKFTNWQRKKGCKCQYKHVVDWCGCSPSVFTLNDSSKLKSQRTKDKLQYFARKFESIIDQNVISQVESQCLNGLVSPFNTHPSFDHVWINIYDHQDSSFLPDNSSLIFLDSLSRQFLWQMECPECVLQKLNQIHTFRANDGEHKMILAKFTISCSGEEIQFELLTRRKVESNPGNVGDFPFLLDSIDVGTNFDLKEEIFRNYIGVFGENSKPSVRHVWSKSIVANETNFKLTIVWVDPFGVIQSALSDTVSLIHNGIHHTNFEHHSLDKAGVWTVKILAYPHDTQLYQLDFPVFPQDTKDGLAASLTERFFEISSACVVKPDNVWTAKCALIHKFNDCQETDWSSIFPDPKSEIKSGFDEKIGWLV